MSSSSSSPLLGMIGAGNMGSSLIGGLIQKGYSPTQIIVCDRHLEKCAHLHQKYGIRTTSQWQDLIQVEVLVIAIKPAGVLPFLTDLAPCLLEPFPLLISVAAGLTTSQLHEKLNGKKVPLIRAMPNTPTLMGVGVTGLFATAAVSSLQRQQAQQLFQAVGEAVWLEEENWLDIVTALSGSGPAYFFYFMEGLRESAIAQGLPAKIANQLTLDTALGSAYMARHSQEDIQALRQQVTSPGGTTEQALEVLKAGKLNALLAKALRAATEHCKILSEKYQ